MMKQFFDKDRDDGTILSETHTYMFEYEQRKKHNMNLQYTFRSVTG